MPSIPAALPSAPPVLSTTRLDLRVLVDGDADAVCALFSDPEAMRYWSTAPWSDPAEGSRLIARDRAGFAAGEAIRFGLVERGGSLVIGCCSIHHIDWSNRRAEIGYILRRSDWGRGLMHEALTALVAFGFDGLSLRRLEADIDPRNVASARSLDRLGFVREGFMRGRWLIDGEVCDSAFYGLLKSDRSQPAPIDNRSCPPGVLVPVLIYDDLPRAIDWLCAIVGCTLRLRAGDGHAQLTIGDTGIMLGASRHEVGPDGEARMYGPPSDGHVSQSLLAKVADVAAHHARVAAAGAHIVLPLTDQAFGERQYTVVDQEGYRWTFSESIVDVDPATWGAQAA